MLRAQKVVVRMRVSPMHSTAATVAPAFASVYAVPMPIVREHLAAGCLAGAWFSAMRSRQATSGGTSAQTQGTIAITITTHFSRQYTIRGDYRAAACAAAAATHAHCCATQAAAAGQLGIPHRRRRWWCSRFNGHQRANLNANYTSENTST